MTPAGFIAKWKASERNERAAGQEHFIDLCALLGEATPGSDPTGESYAFEKGATRFTGYTLRRPLALNQFPASKPA